MFTIKELIKITNASVLSGGTAPAVKSIVIDSRKAVQGSLYIPIIGKKHDGHDFIADTLKAGAVAVLTSKNIKPVNGRTILLVKDTRAALHLIARAYKERFNARFVGITGSSGKTTTKDMLASILSLAGRTLKTEENFNNEIGVPLTLLKLNKTHKYGVIEMAMQGKGEIDELARIVRPEVSVITNIGDAHIGLLKSKGAIARTKSEILKYHRKTGTAVLPHDDGYYLFLKKNARCRSLSFGFSRQADVSAARIAINKKGVSFNIIFRGEKIGIDLPIPGKHNIYDALAAAAAAFALNVKSAFIKKGLEHFKLSSKRMDISEKNGIRIINDSYNANPSSMKASLEILRSQLPVAGNDPPRKIAVLGDMLELGHFERSSHIDVGKFVAGLGIDHLITVGKRGRLIALGAKKGKMKNIFPLNSNKQAINKIKGISRRNDVILIKGSRGMRMEEIAEGLKHA